MEDHGEGLMEEEGEEVEDDSDGMGGVYAYDLGNLVDDRKNLTSKKEVTKSIVEKGSFDFIENGNRDVTEKPNLEALNVEVSGSEFRRVGESCYLPLDNFTIWMAILSG